MQPDPKFDEAVDYLVDTLRKLQLPEEAWLSVINGFSEISATADPVDHVNVEFPEADSVVKKFDLDNLQKTLEQQLASSNRILLTVDQSKAAVMQNQALLACRRYYARRKTPRSLKVVHAAYKRAILTHAQGPLNRALRRAVEVLLAKSI